MGWIEEKVAGGDMETDKEGQGCGWPQIYIKKHFVFYSEFDQEPVELLEDVVDWVGGGGSWR